MAGYLFEAAFNSVRIDVLGSNVQGDGRRIAQHTYPRRSGADLEDLGRNVLMVSLDFLFIDHQSVPFGAGDYLSRFNAFRAMVAAGGKGTLTHPYLGDITCRIEEFSHSADGQGQPVISCSATFIEEIETEPALSTLRSASPVTSAQDVELEAAVSQLALDELGLTSTAVPLAITEAQEWESNPDLSPREIQLRAATLATRLDQELADFEVATDIDKYPLMKSFTLIQNNSRNLAEAVTAKTNRLVEITVREPLPLRILAAQFYGASQADDRVAEMRDLNPNIVNLVLIPRGTVLKAFAIV